MKLPSLKSSFIFIIFLTINWIYLNQSIFAQESPYIYSCLLTSITPSPVNSTINPSSTIIPSNTPTPTPTNLSECKLVMGTGDKAKADIIILAEDYPNETDFLNAVAKSVVAMNKTNLGSERLNKLNFWALMDLNENYFQGFNCPTAGGAVVACWDHQKAFNTAISRCAGDTYMVLNNDTHRTGNVGGISIWGGTYIYNFALDDATVPHELGHSMAGLMDEYSFGIAAPNGAIAGINCSESESASQTTPCPKWATKFPNVGCFQRCGYTNFFRPNERSIMDRGGSGVVFDFNEPSLVDGWDEILKFFP